MRVYKNGVQLSVEHMRIVADTRREKGRKYRGRSGGMSPPRENKRLPGNVGLRARAAGAEAHTHTHTLITSPVCVCVTGPGCWKIPLLLTTIKHTVHYIDTFTTVHL
ncbi:unnamed protein product [Danaus chrysippus]|uniref:(African queen) hypothetical protein n=1 Tax=Danaus chrysippus TaxID=151541 RepID=A0A8J2QQH6_9NEOP|nr:unnamed protein product [Danaus chrysippus]